MEVGPQFRRRTQTEGQQGLFPAAPHLSDAARYPRGYTPERQREVTSALRIGGDDPVARSAHEPHPSWDASMHDEAKKLNAYHERGLVDAVARSTIPASHLRERREGTYQHQDGAARIGHIAYNPHWADAEGAHGFFQTYGQQHTEHAHEQLLPHRSIVVGQAFGEERGNLRPQRSMEKDERVARTLVHELGHHDSAAHDDWEAHLDRQEVDYNTDSVPAEEAYADHYAAKHYRQDPRLRTTVKHNDYSGNAVGRTPEYRAQRTALEGGRLRPSEDDLERAWSTPTRKVAARSKPIAASPQWHQTELF